MLAKAIIPFGDYIFNMSEISAIRHTGARIIIHGTDGLKSSLPMSQGDWEELTELLIRLERL